MLVETIPSNNRSDSSFLQRRLHVNRRVIEVSVESVVFIFRLRKRKKDIARLYFTRVDNKRHDIASHQGGVDSGCFGTHILNRGFQFQVLRFTSVPGFSFATVRGRSMTVCLTLSFFDGGEVSFFVSTFAFAGSGEVTFFGKAASDFGSAFGTTGASATRSSLL